MAMKAILKKYKWQLLFFAIGLLIGLSTIFLYDTRESNAVVDLKHRSAVLSGQIDILKSQLQTAEDVSSKYESKIDSLQQIIDANNVTITKIKKDKHEKINAVPGWSANDRQRFFDDRYGSGN
jgi:hypothetical protein